MKDYNWTPGQHVVALRDDLRTGELSLASFAADLYEVAVQKGQRPLYEDPARFVALSYLLGKLHTQGILVPEGERRWVRYRLP